MRNIIAILRGIRPQEVAQIADALIKAGILKIEVPLNSPAAFDSVRLLADQFADRAVIGAGTVLNVADLRQVVQAGGQLIVSPDCNIEVIKATKAAGLASWPGVMTPSECFAAIRAGADGLKLFPAALIGPKGVQAMRAVLPPDFPIYAVGGAGPENFAEWHKAGVTGFGIGTALYKAGDSADDVAAKAQAIVRAYDAL